MTSWLHLSRVTLLCAALVISSCQEDKEIVQSLNENEANEIIVVLDSQKISVNKKQVPGREITFSLSVPSSQASAALKILVDNKLPREKQRGFSQVYPQGKGGLIPSRSEEKARFLMGVQGQIENMLEVLPGVIKARVLVVLPDTSIIRDATSPSQKTTASVAVVYNPSKGSLGISKEEIQKLVAAATADLNPADVTVVLRPNQPLVLIDTKKSAPKAKITTAAYDLAFLQKSANTEFSPEFKQAFVSYMDKQHAAVAKANTLMWLFAALAAVGTALGIFGVVRTLKYRR